MGTSGVPWNVDRDTIITAIEKNHGRLTYACRDLHCHYQTLKKRVDADEELQKIVTDARNQFLELLLDSAEDVLLTNLQQKNDLNLANKTAYYVLNTRGRDRGYIAVRHGAHESPEVASDLEDFRRSVAANTRLVLADQQPILDQRSPREQDKISVELGAGGAVEKPPHVQYRAQSQTVRHDDVFLPPVPRLDTMG